MAINPMNANQQQLAYNQAEAAQERSRLLTGFGNLNSEEQIAHAKRKEQIVLTREQREASFVQSENERWNKPNTLADATSSLGPMIPLDTTKPKGDALGDGLGNNIVADGNNNAFKNNATNAAANMYGTNIENSFDREIPPVTAIETNQDTTGMNSLYNKTI